MNMATSTMIAHGKHFKDYDILEIAVSNYINYKKLDFEDITFISTSDCMIVDYCDNNGFDNVIFDIDWKYLETKPCKVKHGAYGTYNSYAPVVTNIKMVQCADALIAFEGCAGNLIKTARDYGLGVLEI